MRIHHVLVLLLVAVGGAIAVAADGGGDASWSPVVYPAQRLPLVFSHARHLARGAACLSCHPAAQSSRSAIDNLLPTEAACRACHPIDRAAPDKVATPVAACAGCHVGYTPGGAVQRVYLPAGPIKFDHRAHAAQACERCHGDLRAVDLATTRHLPSMDTCLSCHTDGAQERACTSCHLAQIGGLVETQFPHGQLVPTRGGLGDEHGPRFARDHRQQASRPGATCGACHERAECLECHQGVVKPLEFHVGNYLLVHATEARRGRPDCSACHRAQTFCVACHERSGLGTRGDAQWNSRDPDQRFHPGNWSSSSPGPAANLHAAAARRSVTACASCHREEDCLQCHSAEPGAVRVSPHPVGWRGSRRCKALDRANRRMCLRCHVSDDELGCDWASRL